MTTVLRNFEDLQTHLTRGGKAYVYRFVSWDGGETGNTVLSRDESSYDHEDFENLVFISTTLIEDGTTLEPSEADRLYDDSLDIDDISNSDYRMLEFVVEGRPGDVYTEVTLKSNSGW